MSILHSPSPNLQHLLRFTGVLPGLLHLYRRRPMSVGSHKSSYKCGVQFTSKYLHNCHTHDIGKLFLNAAESFLFCLACLDWERQCTLSFTVQGACLIVCEACLYILFCNAAATFQARVACGPDRSLTQRGCAGC